MHRTPSKQDPLSLGKPLVVGALADRSSLSNPVTDCDVVELRLDSLGFDSTITEFATNSPLPLLITARGPEEGGQNNMSIQDRIDAYLALLPFAFAIDIELSCFESLSSIINAAKSRQTLIVGSFHDFEKTPSLDYLTSLIGSTADIHKFATMVNEPADLNIHRELLKLDTPLSVMGMGPLGADARPEMMQLGSILNYGYLGDTPTAPNQWPTSKLMELSGR